MLRCSAAAIGRQASCSPGSAGTANLWVRGWRDWGLSPLYNRLFTLNLPETEKERSILPAFGDHCDNLWIWFLWFWTLVGLFVPLWFSINYCSVMHVWHWMRENTFGCGCFLSFLVVARLSQFLYSLYLVIPAGREFVSSDQNVMFWLVSEIATVVRRAEGTPSTYFVRVNYRMILTRASLIALAKSI